MLLWASPTSSKHFYNRLDFTINNHRLSASEQPAIIKAYSQTFKALLGTELSFYYRVVCSTCIWDENRQRSHLPVCEATPSTSISPSPQHNLRITYSKCFCAFQTNNSCCSRYDRWGIEYCFCYIQKKLCYPNIHKGSECTSKGNFPKIRKCLTFGYRSTAYLNHIQYVSD